MMNGTNKISVVYFPYISARNRIPFRFKLGTLRFHLLITPNGFNTGGSDQLR